MSRNAPFIHNSSSVQRTMFSVIALLMPAYIFWGYMWGWSALLQGVFAIGMALILEFLFLRLRNQSLKPALDGSAILTALLICFCLPPTTPFWMIAICMLFAIGFGKHLYGGLGFNPFNPAMLGYAVILISFPAELSQWQIPASNGTSLQQAWHFLIGTDVLSDTLTSATPLDIIRNSFSDEVHNNHLFYKGNSNYLWMVLNVILLLSGIVLLWLNHAKWQSVTAFLTTLTLISLLFYLLDPERYASPILHLFYGSTMIGAFFIITDPVSGATTRRGRFVFGALVAALLYIIRTWGNYPDALAFAVLLSNLSAPLIDYLTRPKPYGT